MVAYAKTVAMSHRFGLHRFLCFAALIFVPIFLFSAGHLLRIDSAKPSDLILVLASEDNQSTVNKGLELIEHGYGNQILIDDNADVRVYGFIRTDMAEKFAHQVSGDAAGRVHVCRVEGDSLLGETKYVRACLSRLSVQTVLLITHDFQSRRVQMTFNRTLPRYSWSVAPVEDPDEFGVKWWQHREWAKNTVTEWLRLTWWVAIDSWQTSRDAASASNKPL